MDQTTRTDLLPPTIHVYITSNIKKKKKLLKVITILVLYLVQKLIALYVGSCLQKPWNHD